MSNTAENLAAVERELAADVAMAEGRADAEDATLPESADQYHVRATANWGTVIMNGTPLVQMDELGNGTAQYDNRAEHVPHDLQARVSGSGQISLLSQIASTNADTPV